MRFFRQSLLGLFLLAVTAGLLAMAGNQIFSAVQQAQNRQPFRPPARERVFAVNVVEARAETIAPVLTAFGEVSSKRTLEIRATSGGALIYLAPGFEDGGQVTADQLLAQVDPVDAQAALDRARADMLDAEAEVRDANRAIEISRDDLAAAQEQASLRQKAYERQVDLRDRGVGTEAAVENAELSASSSRAAVLAKRQALANAAARVDQAQTRLARAEIALAEAGRALADTKVTAGFNGSLSGVSVIEGGLVSPNEKLAELIDPDSLEVSFRLSTAQYARLLGSDGKMRRAPVKVSLDVGGVELVSEGRIDRDSAAVESGQTGRLVYASIASPIGLKPGDFVTVEVREPPVDGVIRLPAQAYGSDGSVLVLDQDNRLESLVAQLVRRQGDDVLVKGEALEGRLVVAERTPLLGAGIGVRPIDPEAGAATQSARQTGDQRPAAGQGDRQGDRQGGGRSTAGDGSGEMITLDPARKQRLIDAINANGTMPANAKDRILGMLEGDEVPKDMVERVESRMGLGG
ncbi:MAG: HlyD family efflux transporter periplasmic adaptor subunit [Paracoccaceae bacterium]|jgi:multidrug efflux pump subunit AcrA (membrane-fusion protein)|nr:HlyD family efflux transporter periplasmic adaptor subunit [Paracoccaceae bacterium]MDP7185991.1 HlyD family efflux transporter periplasmic adaptor subunit [Paracoccaceae bacterium]